MTVRVYRWNDASAPTLIATAGSLIALLDAVLVNGYGTKTAAGWTKAYAGTNVAGYTNAGSRCGVFVDHSTTATTARLYGYESITSGGVVTGPFPTTAQVSGGLYSLLSSTTDSTARPWLIVATEKYFYLWVGYAVTTETGLATNSAMPLIFVGDILSDVPGDAYNFLVMAGVSATYSGYTTATLTNAFLTQAGTYMARPYTQTGTSELNGKTSPGVFSQSGIGMSGATYPDPISGGMLLADVCVGVAGLRRGRIPGLWSPQHALPGNPGDTFTGATGGALAGKTFLLLDASSGSARARVALEISDTVG